MQGNSNENSLSPTADVSFPFSNSNQGFSLPTQVEQPEVALNVELSLKNHMAIFSVMFWLVLLCWSRVVPSVHLLGSAARHLERSLGAYGASLQRGVCAGPWPCEPSPVASLQFHARPHFLKGPQWFFSFCSLSLSPSHFRHNRMCFCVCLCVYLCVCVWACVYMFILHSRQKWPLLDSHFPRPWELPACLFTEL